MQKVKLEDVCKFIRNGANIKNDKTKKGIPITRIETIASGKIDENSMGYADIFDEKYKNYYLKQNDILMSHINSMKHLGKVAICSQNKKIIHGMNLLNIRLKENVFSKYVYYFFKTDTFKKQLNKIVKQSVNQSSFNINDLKKIDIYLPEFQIQVKTVDKLDMVQEIIDIREKQIKELDELIKSQFFEMFNNKSFQVRTINDIAESISAGGDKPKDISKEKNEEYIYPIYANGYENTGLQGFSKEYKIDKKAVTISARGTIGYSIVREKCFTPVVRLITIIPSEEINLIYLKYAIEQINLASSGTSQAQLTVPSLKKQYIVVPPIELQNQFADIVKRIDKQKFEIQKSLEEIQKLQESLMNKYFG